MSSKNKNTQINICEPVLITNFNPKYYFHEKDIEKAKCKKKLLQMTDIGKYSITKPIHTLWIKKNIIAYFKQKKINTHYLSIIDCNAGIGGDSISFSKYFKHVLAIEKNKLHYDVLINNCNAIEIKNIEFVNNNFMDIIDKSNIYKYYTILFMDPPWGGPNYKKHDTVDLDIELDTKSKPLDEVINQLYKYYRYIILKSPVNLKFDEKKFKYKNITMIKEENNKILLIIFEK